MTQFSWQNDTCYCNFIVEINPITGLMTLVSVISLCTIHDHMGDQGAFSSALNRNNTFNQRGDTPTQKFNDRNSTKP